MASTKKFTLDEIKAHNSRDSLYILLHKKVYDVTKFLDEHPGGDEVVVAEAGQDSTDAFEDVGHSDEAREMLPGMYIGEFDDSTPTKTQSGGKKATTQAASTAVETGSNLMYFIPLALLGAYFAYRYYS